MATAAVQTSKSEKSRDSILGAAAKLFRRQGYSATTLRQIAAIAEIKAGSIYYYFNSKEAILDEVPAVKIGDFNALAAQAPTLKGVTPAPWPYFWNAYLEGK